MASLLTSFERQGRARLAYATPDGQGLWIAGAPRTHHEPRQARPSGSLDELVDLGSEDRAVLKQRGGKAANDLDAFIARKPSYAFGFGSVVPLN
jgi:hypothetical protein